MSKSEQHDENRKNCLTIISNLMADREVPHNSLLPIINEAIQTLYVSVSEWGRDMETIEIGWIVANTFCHQLDISIEGGLEKPIE